MGHTIWVDVQGRSKSELPNDNSMMLRFKVELDELCDKLCVPNLSRFYDYSELEAQYVDGEIEGQEPSAATWFDPVPALGSVRSICQHLARHPEGLAATTDSRRRSWHANLIEELQNCQSTLEHAITHNRQFRFLVVP